KGSLPRCIRILILINTDKDQKDLVFKYLKGAKDLRT
ncbi:MAG: chorismate mutase, partial [Chloroflexi bacterium]|nr:chorismate mutase [Chloroflexota bacterium]